jgi:hypothetical protein
MNPEKRRERARRKAKAMRLRRWQSVPYQRASQHRESITVLRHSTMGEMLSGK